MGPHNSFDSSSFSSTPLRVPSPFSHGSNCKKWRREKAVGGRRRRSRRRRRKRRRRRRRRRRCFTWEGRKTFQKGGKVIWSTNELLCLSPEVKLSLSPFFRVGFSTFPISEEKSGGKREKKRINRKGGKVPLLVLSYCGPYILLRVLVFSLHL